MIDAFQMTLCKKKNDVNCFKKIDYKYTLFLHILIMLVKHQ